MTGITMDGTVYRVRIKYPTLERSFRLLSGDNAGTMKTGREERDLLGTGYSYTMQVEPEPGYPADYDAFFQAISAPVDSHSITLPYGQSTLTFRARVDSGTDTSLGMIGGVQRWTGLSVSFAYLYPQRLPE